MVVETPFATVGQADNAYYGSGDGSDDGSGGSDGAEWGQLQEAERLGSGWVLAYQEQVDGERQRWFVIRSMESGLQALLSSGEPYNAKDSDTLADLPHYPNEDDARSAFEKWAEEHGDEGQADDGEWGEWQQLRQVDPWWVYSRSHRTEDRAQFLLAGKNRDGETVFLAPDATIQNEPHIYDNVEAMRAALEAYFRAVQDGDIPEDQQPTGDAPERSEIRESVRQSSSQTASRMVEKLAGQKVLLGVVVVVAIYVYYSHEGSLA